MTVALALLMGVGGARRLAYAAAQASSGRWDAYATRRLEAVCARLKMIPSDDYCLRMSPDRTRATFDEQTLSDLQYLMQLPEDKTRELADSADGRKQGIALFLGWYRGDTRSVLTLAHKIAMSSTETVPAALISDQGKAVPSNQDLREYTGKVLKAWLGSEPPETEGAFDEWFPGFPEFVDADRWVYPWISRVRREGLKDEKADWKPLALALKSLPELQRAVIVAAVAVDGSPPPPEACKMLLGWIGPSTIDQVTRDAQFLATDPWLRQDHEGDLRSVLANSLRELLTN